MQSVSSDTTTQRCGRITTDGTIDPDRLSHSRFRIFLPALRDRLFPGGAGNVVTAFAHRNYRIYASGNAVSLIGVWMQRVAVGWLAWTLTHSGAWLGIISMAEFFPVVFLSPLAGALADRRDRVGIIRVTQIAGTVEATLLAVLVYTGAITIELLFGLTLLLGVFNAVAQPSRLALIPTLVDRAALPSALAINAIIFNSARFLGPAVAGIIIAKLSVAAAFAVNAATYVVFLVAMTNLRGIPALPVAAQTLIQAAVDVRMRGRIMALYGMIFRAGPAVGAVMMGSLSERFGLRLPLAIGALVSCGVWVWTRFRQRRIAETLETDPAA